MALGHPTFAELAVYRIIPHLGEVKADLASLAESMAATGTAFNLTEPMVAIMDNPSVDAELGIVPFWGTLADWIGICRQKGVRFAPGSDAHSLKRVGDVGGCYRLLDAMSVNCSSA